MHHFNLPIAHTLDIVLAARTIKLPQIFAGKKFGLEFMSQWSQDYYVDCLLGGKTKGIFIDVGCAIGTEGSNSYFFEKSRDWTGICIEPVPEDYRKTRAARTCLCFNACAYDRTSIVDFTVTQGFNELSGITSAYNMEHIQRIANERRSFNSERKLDLGNRDIQAVALPLQWFIDAAGYSSVDFISIDVEGAELQVIKGIDFDRTEVGIICFEDNYRADSLPILEYLDKKGFEPIVRLGGDIICVNRKKSGQFPI